MTDLVAIVRKDGTSEFDCVGCGQRIIRFQPWASDPRCATCIHVPGWHDDPDLRRIFGFTPPTPAPKSATKEQ